MDEPFSSLDSIIADKLKNDVGEIWKKYQITILMVNHLIADAIELSDRIIVMGGHPGVIKTIIKVDTPRPRNKRSPEFFELQDRITKLIEE
jgi:ABC-type nitrate/sulfonate/bicarbonate transport system ATPase subunit